MTDAPPVFVIMGVSGSGKSTVGRQVSERLGLLFIEGDACHPQVNIDRMAAGRPLTDDDRLPWVQRIAWAVNEPRDRPAVVACSALTSTVRAWLDEQLDARVHYVWLHAPAAVIAGRMHRRAGHYMKENMLESQLEALEPPRHATGIDADAPIEEVCSRVIGELETILNRK